MLQRASAELKALTYKKEGACFKAAVYTHPECVLQSVSCFRWNGRVFLLGKVPQRALLGSPSIQHGVEGSSHFLALRFKRTKTSTAVSDPFVSGEDKAVLLVFGVFLPYSRGSFSNAVGQSWRRWVCLGRASFASGLLRGLIQPLFHRDLWVAVSSSRHRGDPFASLCEFPFIHEDIRFVFWFCSFNTCSPQPCSTGVKWPICLYLGSATVISHLPNL